ncbi:Desumoylating isopeptidase 1 homolog (DeSI-1) (Polyubiquitinated substrate transporter) (POST) [Durusdinium trenchii]|uniref:Desumoylating isopeptidase 1 homolog (DeSI-1) (Polyubiquitinated substrate transporter) (POST) n=1 Tax=Durusdinium trenchii TaxID=1381693 RepID=A0ABP0N8K8_9DINO
MGSCGTKEVAEGDIVLNVYDVGTSIGMHDLNNVLHMIGTGVYHASTQIGDQEWAYGYCEKGCGVFHCKPRGYPFTYRESINLGPSPLSPEQIHQEIEKLKQVWLGPQYDLLHRNCCHFAVALCAMSKCVKPGQALQVKEVPGWVTNLAAAGATIMAEEHAIEEGVHWLAQKATSAVEGLEHSVRDAILEAAKAGRIAEECFEQDCLGRHKVQVKACHVLVRTGHLKEVPDTNMWCCCGA